MGALERTPSLAMHTVAPTEGFRPLKKRAWEMCGSDWPVETDQKSAKRPTLGRFLDPRDVSNSMENHRSNDRDARTSDGSGSEDRRPSEDQQHRHHMPLPNPNASSQKKLPTLSPQVLIGAISEKVRRFYGSSHRVSKQCTKLEDREKVMLDRGQQTFEKLNNDSIEHVIKGELVHAEINLKKSLKLQESVMLATLEKEVALPFLLGCMVSYAATLSNLGNLYCQMKRAPESIGVYEGAVRVHQSLQGVFSHQDLSALLRNLGYAHNKSDNFGKAAECFRSALRVAARLGQSHDVLSKIHEELLHAEKLASQEYLLPVGR